MEDSKQNSEFSPLGTYPLLVGPISFSNMWCRTQNCARRATKSNAFRAFNVDSGDHVAERLVSVHEDSERTLSLLGTAAIVAHVLSTTPDSSKTVPIC